MKGLLLLLLFVIPFTISQYDPTKPRKRCNDMEGGEETKSWGPHNVLPNLYEHVYRPFLDAFTYTAICKHEDKTPVLCEDVQRIGTLKERCAYIEADSMLEQYAIIIHYLTEEWWLSANKETMMLLDTCGDIIRKGESEYHPYKECIRSTLAYQCVWNNSVWLAIPVILVFCMGIIFSWITFFSACMLAFE